MGRMWNALRRDAKVAEESGSSRTAPTEEETPMIEAPEEIPFIEVGPRKSVEASPSVLACEKKTDKIRMNIQKIPIPPTETPVPRTVPFRSVFLAAADTEEETPQDNA